MIQYGDRTHTPVADRLEGTIQIVAPGGLVTLQDGTMLAVPWAVMAQDRLRPGVVIVAEYEPEENRKIATALQIRGCGLG